MVAAAIRSRIVNYEDKFKVDKKRRPATLSRFPHPRAVAMAHPIRHDWTRAEVAALFALPFNELLHRAHSVHREHHDPNAVQVSTLLSIKTGGCPEDCAYCPQAARYDTGVEAQKLMSVDAVLARAQAAKNAGASRFCMGAAWRSPKDRDVVKVAEIVRAVKGLGLETCATLGMLSGEQAQTLKQAGLDYYNHNLDTAPEFYGEIIHTRQYQDRLDTLEHVREAGLKTCCGGIVGMGETRDQRAGLLQTLATLPEHPESVPINQLVQVEGTPLNGTAALDPFDFVRTIAVARILMPASMVRLSAGRQQMDDAVQALCFFAGANSIFYGEKLLTTGNPDVEHDRRLFARLNLHPMEVVEESSTVHADIMEAEAASCGNGCGCSAAA
jgi:biotin synthase